MKMMLPFCFVLICGSTAIGAGAPKGDQSKPGDEKAVKAQRPVRNYHDVLAVIPKDLEPGNARHWSQPEKDVANIILKKKLVDVKRPASMKLRVADVSSWQTMTPWSHIPNDEGYAIRVFTGVFKNPDALVKLATLKPGNMIQLDGILDHVVYEKLWGGDSLSICLRDGSFTRLLENGKVAPPLPLVKLSVVSAVYGSGDKFSDVTDRVKSFMREPGTAFTAQPHWLGADPTPGWNKALVIVYELAGKRHIFSTGEGGAVSAERLVKHAGK